MGESYATLAHRWFEEVWNQGRESAIDELMAEDSIVHGLVDRSEGEIRGPAAFKPFVRKFRTGFPDIRINVEDVVVEGDKIAARCVVTGTHTGPGIMSAPTGRPTEITGMCIVRVKDGKIAEGWNNFDFLTLYQQLGMQLT
jgi:steroid delta-isomerase-like uncharacterized protein